MKSYLEMNKEELELLLNNLEKEYNDILNLKLELNMARGKPDLDQLDISMDMLDVITSKTNLIKNMDYRNYGILDGIDEAKQMFADLLETDTDHIVIYGNSSLNLMFDQISRGYTHGYMGETPWCKLDKIKFLCPAPGYDRHFAITQRFGFELITIPMTKDGPDMELVEQYVNNDDSVKGMWCVPQYSNPLGTTYSDETVKRLAALKPAAKDFRLFWDNAYLIHHLYDDKQDHVLNIIEECEKAGNEHMYFEFTSTSKVTFPGSGVSVVATSPENKKDLLKHMTVQTIGHDKINQLRHVEYFKNVDGIKEHMKKHANILRPKFEAVLEIFDKELNGLNIGSWTKPVGGYFISFDSLDGCAKDIVKACKDAGAILTDAGATYPYGNDPKDSNIRIAPSYPNTDELIQAANLFILCVKLVSVRKLLKNM